MCKTSNIGTIVTQWSFPDKKKSQVHEVDMMLLYDDVSVTTSGVIIGTELPEASENLKNALAVDLLQNLLTCTPIFLK
jgi:hypothetical protein